MPTDPQLGVQLPPYQPAPKFHSEKGDSEMYPFTQLDFNVGDVQNRYKGVLAPLSLFAPYPHEDERRALKEENENIRDLPLDTVELERPVTPINDEIKCAPINFNKLAKMVRRRIAAKPEVDHLGMDEQKELSAIIMGEVNGVWPDIRMQVNDPFLSEQENQELQRRITVHIVTVCEQLFEHYLQKAQILNRRGVFSGPANMSRLKAQLAVDTNKFLNVLTIRRYIVSDMRRERDGDYSSDEEDDNRVQAEKKTGRKAGLPAQPAPALSYKSLTKKTNKSVNAPIDCSRPKSKNRKHRYLSTDAELREMRDNMPGLDTSKLLEIVADLPHARPPSSLTDDWYQPGKHGKANSRDQLAARRTSEDQSRDKLVLKKAPSVLQLQLGETLFEELGIEPGRLSAKSAPDDELFMASYRSQQQQEEDTPAKPQPGTREYAAQDLRRLVGKTGDEDDKEDEDDLAPLLQAVTRSAKHDGKQQLLDKQLKELEEREAKRREEESIILREPTHPQPATVSTKLPNQEIVRTSDIRVSERVCLSSITLNKHATVYNDLIDEIDAVTVKKLDSNLFLGDEVTEVYKEIMKTVPTDHLELENDDEVEPSADSVNLTACLASSTLHGKQADRIVNPKLHKDITPPWGSMQAEDWAKTPLDPPKDMRGRPMIHPMTPKGNGEAMRDLLGDRADQYMQQDAVPDIMQEVMARSYASWLLWWKNTINSDDYMKYLSTQESDYMGVLFHFYDSDNEDEEEDRDVDGKQSRAARRAKQQTVQGEKEKRMEELKSAKSEFREGFWNVNSVLLGGLGKDPEIENEEQDTGIKTPVATETTQTTRTPRSKTMVVSRKSQRSGPPGEDGTVDGLLGTATRDSERTTSRYTDFTKSIQKTQMSMNTAGSKSPEPRKEETPEELTAQDRLERVWAALHMPDAQKLDMAIKYSSDQYHDKLNDAIEDWEQATTLVLQREQLVARLENFERLASDPNRFFEKGYRGSSVARLEEARIRSTYYKKIDQVEVELKSTLEDISKDYNDTVTFQGRPYADKMQWDRTEMLYWLQEERKQQALQFESRLRTAEMPMKMAILEPIGSAVAGTVQ